jgi:hypothetical protein
MADVVERQVAPEQWGEFCKRWGQTHRGWLVTIDETGGATFARERALGGVELGENRTLMITLDGHAPGTLDIGPVTGIVERFSDGAHAGLGVQRGSQPPVLVSFRVPALPEMLDGVAEEER